MVRKAVKFGCLGLWLVLGGCTEGEDSPAEGDTTGADAGDMAGEEAGDGPDEPLPTSASASTSASTADPDETTGGEGTSGGEEEESGEESGSGESGEEAELSCSNYCAIYMDACQDYSEFANPQHCLDHCAQWPVGTVEDVAGDSLGCRTYHVTVASSTDPNLHCPHSGPSGELTCIDPEGPSCDIYCTRYFNNCEGDLNLWADMDACMGQCALWYQGQVDDTEGHTVGCRSYYANLAAADAEQHCPNAGPGGGQACVL